MLKATLKQCFGVVKLVSHSIWTVQLTDYFEATVVDAIVRRRVDLVEI